MRPIARLRFNLSRINFPRLCAIGGANDAISFHLLNHPSRTVVAYPQSALNHRDRRLLRFRDDGHGLIIHLVVFIFRGGSGLGFALGLENFRPLIRPTLLLDKFHHAANFLIGNESAVHADQTSRPRG